MPDDEYEDIVAAALPAPKKARPALDYQSLYQDVGKKYGVDPDLLYRQAKHESVNFNPHFVYGPGRSPKGAAGLAQFMPQTARQYGLRVGKGQDDRFDPVKSADAHARLMKDLIDKYHDPQLALSAYNSGTNRTPESARRAMQRIPETKNYVQKIAPQSDGYDDIVSAAIPKTVQAPQEDSYNDVIAAAVPKNVSPLKRRMRGTQPAPTNSIYAAAQERYRTGTTMPQTGSPYDVNQILTDVRTQGRQPERVPYRTPETAVPLEKGRQQLAAAHEVGVAQEEARSLPFAGRILPQELNRFASKAERAIAGLADYADRLPHPGRGQGPNLTQQVSEYLKQRAQISGEIGDYAPEDENLPKTAVRAVANAGMDLASLIAITRATGLPFPIVMAGEAALNNSDKPKAEIAKATGEAYLWGKAYEYIPGAVAKKLKITGQVGTRALGAGLFATAGAGQAAYQGADTKHVIAEGIGQGALGLLGGPHEKAQRQGVQAEQPAQAVQPERVDVGIPNERGSVAASDAGGRGESGTDVSTPQRFYHRDYGEVVETESQVGARKGKVRIAEVDNPESVHYVRRSDLSGKGNQRLVPIKESASEPVQNSVMPAENRQQETAPQEQSTVSTPSAPPVEVAKDLELDAPIPNDALRIINRTFNKTVGPDIYSELPKNPTTQDVIELLANVGLSDEIIQQSSIELRKAGYRRIGDVLITDEGLKFAPKELNAAPESPTRREVIQPSNPATKGEPDVIPSATQKASEVVADTPVREGGDILPQSTSEAGYLNPKVAKEGVYEPATTPILQEVERATLNGNAQRPSLRQYARRAKSYVQRSLIAEFTPLRELEQTLYGKETVPVVNLARKFEQVAGAPAKAQADIIDFRRSVIDPIRKHADDFNSFLFLKRVEDRLQKEPERKRVADWSVKKAQAGLAELEAKVGPDKYKELAKAGKVYQKEMDKALRLQVESGRMSQELYDAIKESSDFYAPFKVLRYIEDSDIVRGSGRRIATTQELSKKIKGIDSEDFQLGNILQASAEQIVRSRILAEKNLKMLELDKLADLDSKGELIKRITEDKARPAHGKEFVRFLKDGKEQTLEVDHTVANAVQGLNPKQAGLLATVMMKARKPLQVGATSANAGFQAVNLFFADLPRASLVSRYGVRNIRDVYQFPLDWTYSLFTSMKGNFGKPNQLYMDWLRSGAANSTIQKELTPEAFRPTLGIEKPGAKHLAKSVINSVAQFSNAIEETSKVLGLKRGMKLEGVAKMSPAERQQAMEKIASEVRNYSGSPDFARKGSETRDLNLLFMFFNARLQGVGADLARLAGKTGTKDAAVAWARLGTVIALPSALLAVVNNSPGYKEDYDKIPDWEKKNYWMIPRNSYFKNEDTGETVRDYWRIPKRELGQLIGNTTESAVQFGMTREPKVGKAWAVDMIENMSPINIQGRTMGERAESVFSSTNPALKLPAESLMNRDTFRHRDIVPEYMKKAAPAEQYRESTPRGYVTAGKALGISPLQLEHATEGLTGSAASQFSIREQQPGRSALGRFPLTRRFVRSGQTAVDDTQTQEQTDFATKQLQRRRARQEAVKKYRAGEISKADLDKLEEEDTLTESDVKRVQKEAGMSNSQQRFTAIPPNIALDRFERMDTRQRNEVVSLMEHKAYNLLNSSALTDAQKEAFKTRIDALGITPRDPRKKSSTGFKSAFGKGFSRNQFARP